MAIKKVKQTQVEASAETSAQVVQLLEQLVALTQPKVKAHSVCTEEEALINEAVQINAKLIELEVPAMQKRLDEIKKIFQAKSKELPPDVEAIFVGTEGRLVFSKARTELEITDRPALVKALGQKVFNSIAKVGVTDLRKYLAEDEIAKVTAKVPGSRSIKLIEKL